MTTELRRRFIDDMTLHGLAPTTQNVYVNAVRQLAARYGRSPDQLSEQELRDYFTYLIKEKRLASSTLRTQIFGIKFLYTKTLQKPWPTLKLLRARRREKLPVVLDPAEAKRLLAVERRQRPTATEPDRLRRETMYGSHCLPARP